MSEEEKSTAELVCLIYDTDKTVRNAAAMELGRRGHEGFAAALPLMADESWVIRYRACEIIGMTKLPEAYSVLVDTLADPRDHVRYMAVKGLGILGDIRALTPVLQMLKDENPFVQRMAQKVVGELSNTSQ